MGTSTPLVGSIAVWLGAFTVIGCGGGNGINNSDGGNSGCGTNQIKFDNLCVTTPSIEAERTQCGDVTEFCDKTGMKTPVLDCLALVAPKMHPTEPKTVTLTGYVHPFSSGSANAKVSVQIFKAADLAGGKDISTVAPLSSKEFGFDPSTAADLSQFRVCDKDAKIGCVPVSANCMPHCVDGLPGAPTGMDGKPLDNKVYCLQTGQTTICSDRLRWERRFSLDNIPTNTPLVIRTSGEGGVPSNNWNTLVQWNVFLATDDKSCGGDTQAVDCVETADPVHPKYQLNVNVISQTDYGNIPVAAGISGGISPSEGAIAGEVHDCDNIRVGNAQMAVSPAGDRLTYFNGNPFMTVPDSGRATTGTDRLGLFSSLNIAPGKVVVEAVGKVGGKSVSLGKYTAIVYPGVVSVVNINGGKPVQMP